MDPEQVFYTLNIGAGKTAPLDVEKNELVTYLDKSYDESFKLNHKDYMTKIGDICQQDNVDNAILLHDDIWEFLSRCPMKFNKIIMYRFLEHIPRASLLYFIYLLSDSLRPKGTLDIIVPNYKLLAEMLLSEDGLVGTPEFENHDIIVTTELVNEPSCPHASVWTPNRAEYYLEVEKRFKVTTITPRVGFEGRDIYMRIQAVKTF